jgi:hypothetical protein
MKYIKLSLFYFVKILLAINFIFLSCASVKETESESEYSDNRISEFRKYFNTLRSKYGFHESVKLDKILISDKSKTIKFYFNKNIGYIPFRLKTQKI